MEHHIRLSNGRRLVIQERYEELSIATADKDGDIEYYICSLDINGVSVYTNSGTATWNLVEGLNDE